MSVTVATLVQLTRRRLHEANASTVGEMPTGSGGAATVSGELGIIEALNRVAAEICRTCYYYEAIGTATVTTRTLTLSALGSMSPSGAVIWSPLYVSIGGTPLTYVQRGVLPASDAISTTTAVPAYWLDGAEGVIELNPTPSSNSVKVQGAAIPAEMTSGGAAQSWMPDELLQKILPAGAASRLAMTEADNPALAARGPLWQAEYDLERMKVWQQNAFHIQRRFFPVAPGAV